LGLSIIFVVLVSYQVISWLSKKPAAKFAGPARGALRRSRRDSSLPQRRDHQAQRSLARWRHALARRIEQDPTNPRAYMNLGVYLRRIGEYKQAEELIEKAVRMTPNDPSAFMLRALFSIELGRSAAALEDLNRAIDLDGKAIHAYYYRGELYENKEPKKRSPIIKGPRIEAITPTRFLAPRRY
jgi:tetratricopeptide (TPR) repeat protein